MSKDQLINLINTTKLLELTKLKDLKIKLTQSRLQTIHFAIMTTCILKYIKQNNPTLTPQPTKISKSDVKKDTTNHFKPEK